MEKKTNASILVSGVTGNVGSEIAKKLSAQGIPFRALVRTNSAGTARISSLPGVEMVTGDFDDGASLRTALSGIDRAFLLTNSTEKAQAQQEAFVDAAKSAGVRHIVKLSQWAADRSSPVRFLRYHAAVEQHIVASGLSYDFLRPNLFMQGLLGFKEVMTSTGQFFAPIGNAPVSVIDIRDIAAVAVQALTDGVNKNRILSLTGPQSLRHEEMAEKLSEALKKKIAFTQVAPEAMLQMLLQTGFPEWQAEGLVEDYAHYDRGEAAEVTTDVRIITGKEAIAFDQFASDYRTAFTG